jgi:hypothetical protein
MYQYPQRPWLLLRSLLQSKVFVWSVSGITAIGAVVHYKNQQTQPTVRNDVTDVALIDVHQYQQHFPPRHHVNSHLPIASTNATQTNGNTTTGSAADLDCPLCKEFLNGPCHQQFQTWLDCTTNQDHATSSPTATTTAATDSSTGRSITCSDDPSNDQCQDCFGRLLHCLEQKNTDH